MTRAVRKFVKLMSTPEGPSPRAERPGGRERRGERRGRDARGVDGALPDRLGAGAWNAAVI